MICIKYIKIIERQCKYDFKNLRENDKIITVEINHSFTREKLNQTEFQKYTFCKQL